MSTGQVLIALAVLSLALASFSNEATLMSFALPLAQDEIASLTLLYALSMTCGIVASCFGT